MPDITTLPALCGTLEISVEELLHVPEEQKKERILRDFVKLAVQAGREELLLEAAARSFNQSGKKLSGGGVSISAEALQVWLALEEGGVSFTARNYHESAFQCGSENLAYYFSVLADERVLEIFKLTSPYDAVTAEEVCSSTGYDAAVVGGILLELMNRNMLCSDVDYRGKRGYLQASGMIGVYMALFGAAAAGCGGVSSGFPINLWFRHIPESE